MPNERLSEIAKMVIESNKNAICNELRPLYRAVASLPAKETEKEAVFTDGSYFYYNPTHLLREYKDNKNNVTRLFLHSLFHCIYLHLFKVEFKNRQLWDLACDIFVEKTINDYNLNCTSTPKASSQEKLIDELAKHIKNFTTENLYYYLSCYPLSLEYLNIYKSSFYADCHDVWYINKCTTPIEDNDEETVEARSIYKIADEQNGDYQEADKTIEAETTRQSHEKEEEWRDITKRIIRDSQTVPSVFGNSKGFDSFSLKTAIRKSYDYSEFLKKFVQITESLEINDDEFDYIYYTYGLKLHENIPLIEPLEYSENSKLRRIIIAIDTSGSVYGKPVKNFIEKTYSILNNSDFIKNAFEIHIIQCDCSIQSVDIIRSAKDLDDYVENLTLKGFGGTDFTPVFDYADEILKTDPNKPFNGVIYFTDGDGLYPQKTPTYKNAFVIYDNGFDESKMPLWATPIYMNFTDDIG